MPTLNQTIFAAWQITTEHPESILLWAISGVFVYYLFAKSMKNRGIAPVVMLTFMILFVSFLVGGLIYDPEVSFQFRQNLLGGVVAMGASVIAGGLFLLIVISYIIGAAAGYAVRDG